MMKIRFFLTYCLFVIITDSCTKNTPSMSSQILPQKNISYLTNKNILLDNTNGLIIGGKIYESNSTYPIVIYLKKNKPNGIISIYSKNNSNLEHTLIINSQVLLLLNNFNRNKTIVDNISIAGYSTNHNTLSWSYTFKIIPKLGTYKNKEYNIKGNMLIKGNDDNIILLCEILNNNKIGNLIIKFKYFNNHLQPHLYYLYKNEAKNYVVKYGIYNPPYYLLAGISQLSDYISIDYIDKEFSSHLSKQIKSHLLYNFSMSSKVAITQYAQNKLLACSVWDNPLSQKIEIILFKINYSTLLTYSLRFPKHHLTNISCNSAFSINNILFIGGGISFNNGNTQYPLLVKTDLSSKFEAYFLNQYEGFINTITNAESANSIYISGKTSKDFSHQNTNIIPITLSNSIKDLYKDFYLRISNINLLDNTTDFTNLQIINSNLSKYFKFENNKLKFQNISILTNRDNVNFGSTLLSSQLYLSTNYSNNHRNYGENFHIHLSLFIGLFICMIATICIIIYKKINNHLKNIKKNKVSKHVKDIELTELFHSTPTNEDLGNKKNILNKLKKLRIKANLSILPPKKSNSPIKTTISENKQLSSLFDNNNNLKHKKALSEFDFRNYRHKPSPTSIDLGILDIGKKDSFTTTDEEGSFPSVFTNISEKKNFKIKITDFEKDDEKSECNDEYMKYGEFNNEIIKNHHIKVEIPNLSNIASWQSDL